jgi:ADP-ribosyl-[dinitrogen reductase] hydrolase
MTAERYVAWWRTGKYSPTGHHIDIGTTIHRALKSFECYGDAASAGPKDDYSSGNGSIMRLAPVPIAFLEQYHTDFRNFVKMAIESSLPTHGSDMCLSACAALAVMLAALASGVSKNDVLHPKWPVWMKLEEVHPIHESIVNVINGSYLHKNAREIRGSGFVVESLEAALWAFESSDSFEEAVLKAVNLGEDADTTGAICGQLAGAHWGESGIPPHLFSDLCGRDFLEAALVRIT